MSDWNPYESTSRLPSDTANHEFPLNFIFSAMVAWIATLLAGFLLYTGLFYGFQWPGVIKSAIAFTILSVCIAYAMIRGRKELAQIREFTGQRRRVGIVHVLLIVAFCFAIRGFAHWVMLNTTY